MKMSLIELPRMEQTNEIVDAIIYSGKEEEVTKYLSLRAGYDIEYTPVAFLQELYNMKGFLFLKFNLKKIGEQENIY